MDSQQFQIIIEALGAGFLGGIIGFEREMSNKPAGLRTYILISASACLLVNFGTLFIDGFKDVKIVQIDPLRTIEAIIVGVSFIGGGMIIKSKDTNNVINLTTAALTLFAATIGISIALQLYVLGIFITFFSLLISFVLYKFEENLPEKISKK